jgi:hypothetical protein
MRPPNRQGRKASPQLRACHGVEAVMVCKTVGALLGARALAGDRVRGWPAQCPGVPLHRQGHPKILSEPLRRNDLQDPPLSAGASAPPPARDQGPGGSLPDPTRAIPCAVRAATGRPPESCARYVPDGVGDQGNSRPVTGTCFLPLTSHGTGQRDGRDRLLSSRSMQVSRPHRRARSYVRGASGRRRLSRTLMKKLIASEQQDRCCTRL